MGLLDEPIAGIVEREDAWVIGVLELSRRDAVARPLGGFSQAYRDDARLWLDEGGERVVVWFRVFEHARTTGEPEDVVVGFVAPARRAEAEGWLVFLNAQVARLGAEARARDVWPPVAELLTRLASPQPFVRLEACWMLGRCGDTSPAVVAALVHALDDDGVVEQQGSLWWADDDDDRSWFEQWSYVARQALHALARVAPTAAPDRVRATLRRLDGALLRREHGPLAMTPELRLRWRPEHLAPFGLVPP